MMMYFVIALELYMLSSAREVLRCLLESLQWMALGGRRIHMAGDAGISLALSRLGYEPVQRLHDEVVGPVATPCTHPNRTVGKQQGACRCAWWSTA